MEYPLLQFDSFSSQLRYSSPEHNSCKWDNSKSATTASDRRRPCGTYACTWARSLCNLQAHNRLSISRSFLQTRKESQNSAAVTETRTMVGQSRRQTRERTLVHRRLDPVAWPPPPPPPMTSSKDATRRRKQVRQHQTKP
uniref:RING-H2 finger protein ATL39-like n=1 Tax=Rhizophora mucronata TaxID=61149 RepID=A0A2P2IMC1_RHIMU